ncbi:MAG TPA: PEP/pyruvate-binding domain-containing protein [Dehalococcoidales bacterium]|nr:PEP/pyruvate-binding domain-containing protein [Dehalococcoidales bacterium]
MSEKYTTIASGNPALDELLQGIRLGDNVVWQVDRLDDYGVFSRALVERSIADGFKTVYVRFADHAPILTGVPGLEVVEVDPLAGFDIFSSQVHHIIEGYGRRVIYVFDNLSYLVTKWATDELLANFFQITCPYLFELDTVTYFALTRNRHASGAVARIRDTTQVLLDLYRVDGQTYVHPLKVWDRYSSQMFLPHILSADGLEPVFRSGEAAAVLTSAGRRISHRISSSIAPWDAVYTKLMQYQLMNLDEFETMPEVSALRQELTRMLFGNHPEFNKLADRYLNVDDLINVRDRLIGSGRIGGKAAGMLVARKVLEKEPGKRNFKPILEEHDSFYIGSDVFFTFLVNNNLFRIRLQLSRASQITHEEFENVEKLFLAGQFSGEIIDQFKVMLEYFGQAPIIVRSSSLLEDSYGNAFAGKYRSEYCPNQGSPEERLEAFLKAVKLVYASAVNPDALLYRRKRGLGEGDEQMAILVQRVSGIPYHHYFFPSLAGVAFSRNLYAWTDRIDPQKGLIRLVFGLGTRAVNRVGGDYPRMIAVSHPELRPEVGAKISKYSQRIVDVLNLERNQLISLPLREVLVGTDYPNLHLLVSYTEDGYLHDPAYGMVEASPENLVLTFNNLLIQTNLIEIMEELLAKLEKAWGQPVDIEFTAIIDKDDSLRINLLQCRPLRLPRISESLMALPQHLTPDQILFKSNRTLSGGIIEPIRYIIYIDARKYAAISSMTTKKSLGRIVGSLNAFLRGKDDKIMAIGPGRWGSSNIDLGVNVSYADIDNVKVLVEAGRTEAGHEPELSYGTHFFQDLVEADIIYLPIFPDQPETQFNRTFFTRAPNSLARLMPEYAEFQELVQVIEVPKAAKGAYAHVVADTQTRTAICYLQ